MTELIRVKGAVQGVGYRPFILKKATEYGLSGYVKNIGAAVDILVTGDEDKIRDFAQMLRREYPSGAFIVDVLETTSDSENIDLVEGFQIIHSSGNKLSDELPVFLPDIGICDECLKEMLDPKDRRYRYPLISCASCGPRISILNKLPYDRDTTTMDEFKMCPQCHAEYRSGRRTHAQTISCFKCGPQIELKIYKDNGAKVLSGDEAINEAVSLLKQKNIVGLKGISGYQLLALPDTESARKLRIVKGRENKPFAVMFPDTETINQFCNCNTEEEQLLKSSARPIVLLDAIKEFPYEVAGDSRYIGAFLPAAGIHKLLVDELGPLIVSSANISNEPIIIDDQKFDDIFGGKVSACLLHKRKINIPQDDSVAYVTKLSGNINKSMFIRRARGYFPLPVFIDITTLPSINNISVFAAGGDLKNTFAIGKKDRIIVSSFLGDMESYDISKNRDSLSEFLHNTYDFKEDIVICDMHPLYHSSKFAKDISLKSQAKLVEVQHHHAHILSVMAENSLNSAIGIAFDGTGYGTDGNIWGGEILYCLDTEFTRMGQISYVKLCGGDNAPKNAELVKECYDYSLDKDNNEISGLVKSALNNNIGCYWTSSIGRLFDAISALLDIKKENTFEGECAIALENEAWKYVDSFRNKEHQHLDNCLDSLYPVDDDIYREQKVYLPVIDDRYMDQSALYSMIKEHYLSGKYTKDALAYYFHKALVKAATILCVSLRNKTGENKVCLSGGVFANRLLVALFDDALKKEGFAVYFNEKVSCNDSGISLGQAYFGLLV